MARTNSEVAYTAVTDAKVLLSISNSVRLIVDEPLLAECLVIGAQHDSPAPVFRLRVLKVDVQNQRNVGPLVLHRKHGLYEDVTVF